MRVATSRAHRACNPSGPVMSSLLLELINRASSTAGEPEPMHEDACQALSWSVT